MPAPLTASLQRVLALTAAAVMAATLFLVGTGTPAQAADHRNRNERIMDSAKTVKRQIGDRYQYGASGPNRFDCSGLIKYSFKRNGLKVPRTSDAQANAARRIKKRNMMKGDLMFFHDGGDVYHVAMFVGWRDGRRRMVHASRSGVPVKRDAPWTKSWYAGTMRRR